MLLTQGQDREAIANSFTYWIATKLGYRTDKILNQKRQVPWDSPLNSTILQAYDSLFPRQGGMKIGVGGSEGKHPYYLLNMIKKAKFLFVSQGRDSKKEIEHFLPQWR